MTDYLIKEDVFMALTGDITDCTIEEFIARLREKLSKLPSIGKDINVTTNKDCISRQAVLSYICNDLGFGDEENGYDLERKIAQEEISNFVEKMPPVTPKGKTDWIPVTKRVPQECIHTYDNNFHDYTRSESVLVTIRNKVTNSVYVFHDLAYISNGEWYIDSRYDHEQFKNCSVIAWMPLPEPYKSQESEE